MTAVLETSSGPTVRSVARSSRGPVLVGAVLLVSLVLLALLGGQRGGAPLDPHSFSPGGTRALAALLARQGSPVEVVDAVPSDVPSGTTMVVPFPQESDLSGLASAPGRLVLVDPSQKSLDALGLGLRVADSTTSKVRPPGCELNAAVRAGSARSGGTTWSGGTICYAGTLASMGPSRFVLGSGQVLTNDQLGQDGNASLALGLVRPADRVLWLLPRAPRPGSGTKTLHELLPEAFLEAVLQLGIATAVLALWRARRLGRVVTEPLPVVVRGSEAVEGRGRLYRTTRARPQAAAALRSASLDAAASRLSLGPSPEPSALLTALAERTGRSGAELRDLLYGPPPADDAALVALADALSRLDQEVAGS